MLARELNNQHAIHMEGVIRAYEDKINDMQKELSDMYGVAMELSQEHHKLKKELEEVNKTEDSERWSEPSEDEHPPEREAIKVSDRC